MKDPFPEHTRRKKIQSDWIKSINDVYYKIGNNKKPLTEVEMGVVWSALGRYLDIIAIKIKH